MKAIYALVVKKITNSCEDKGIRIKVTKRSVPTNTTTASHTLAGPFMDMRTDHLKANAFDSGSLSLVIKILFAKYIEQVAEAHKPLVFKPPV